MEFTNDLSGAENTAKIGNQDPMEGLMPKVTDNGSTESLTRFEVVAFQDKHLKALPVLFSEVTENLSYAVDKVAMLHNLLIMASGLLPNVYFTQKGKPYYLNLMGYHIAPPGSGKGMLGPARKLADKVQEQYKRENEQHLTAYKQALAEWKRQKQTERGPEPNKPALPVLVMPDDTTKAMLIQNLMASDGHGIFLGSEADTTSSANKGEHGSFSDLLRKAAEHETVSKGTKQDGNLEITTPRLTVALTSTPGQLPRLMQDGLDDGLLSRFIYLYWPIGINPLYLNQDLGTLPGYACAMERAKEAFYTAYYSLLRQKNGLLLEFTPAQKEACFEWGKSWHEDFIAMMPDIATGTTKRAGVNLYRIAGILEIVQRMSSGEQYTTGPITCSDAAFSLAMDLMDTYMGNANKVITFVSNLKGSKPAKELFTAQVIALLNHGKTQAEIARMLGVNRMKVNREVSRLSKQVGRPATDAPDGMEQQDNTNH